MLQPRFFGIRPFAAAVGGRFDLRTRIRLRKMLAAWAPVAFLSALAFWLWP